MATPTVITSNSGPTAPKQLGRRLPFIIAALGLLAAAYFLGVHFGAKNSSKTPRVSSASASTVSAPTGATSDKLSMPDLGVSITLPDALRGTKYRVIKPPVKSTSAPTIVGLQLDGYSKLVNQCLGSTSSINQYFAALVKGSGTTSPANFVKLKQFDSFYVANMGPSLPSTTKCKDSATQQQFDDLNTSLNSALQAAFSTANKI